MRKRNEEAHLANIRTKRCQLGRAFQKGLEHEMAWNAAQYGVSSKVLEFAQKAKIDVNPHAVNMSTWLKVSSDCKICKEKTGKRIPQTLAHILGSCAISRGIESEDQGAL
jgi:hypothetical protein